MQKISKWRDAEYYNIEFYKSAQKSHKNRLKDLKKHKFLKNCEKISKWRVAEYYNIEFYKSAQKSHKNRLKDLKFYNQSVLRTNNTFSLNIVA